MSLENNYLLDNMEKYSENFNREMYENNTEAELIRDFKIYYDALPKVDLLTWCRVNAPSDEMCYKQGYWNQITLIRDKVNRMFYKSYEEFKENPVMVIGTHRTKSITMPVYEIDLPQYGIKMILRDNLHNWKVSIVADNPLYVDFKNTFRENDKPIPSVYCEGFKEDQVFGRYCDNQKQFTVEISGSDELYVFMWLLSDHITNYK